MNRPSAMDPISRTTHMYCIVAIDYTPIKQN
jgi:hypothetical protein